MIQRLLVEDGKFPSDAVGGDLASASVTPRGAEVAAEWDDVRSPETYLGYESADGFASPGGATPDERRAYATPARLRLNQWALAGEWTIQPQGAVVNAASGRIAYRFHARDLNLAMGPVERGAPVRVRVLLDGAPPGAAHGYDLDDQGNGTLADQRLYQLIRQPRPIADRQFEIEFLDAGAVVCVFTFG
jgi:hypothetical protein